MDSFIAIIILVVVLVLYIILSKQDSMKTDIVLGEASVGESIEEYMSISTNSIPYSTINGIPFEELFGVYMCYGEAFASYGEGYEYNIYEIIRSRFDEMYGKGTWSIVFSEVSLGKGPVLSVVVDSSPSYGAEIENMRQILDVISPESEIIGLDEFTSIGAEWATVCDKGGDAPFENWGGTPGNLCGNAMGRPVKMQDEELHMEPWDNGGPMMLIIGGDEAVCSGISCLTKKQCPDYGVSEQNEALSKAYVDESIEKCKAAGIKVFVIDPMDPILWCHCPVAAPYSKEQAQRLAHETGGRVINVFDPAAAMAQLTEGLDMSNKEEFFRQISSFGESDTKFMPSDRDLRVYSYVFPCPCKIGTMCKANIIYSPLRGFEDAAWTEIEV
ncbi:MAG: hypothetical protein KKF44_07985 [Nanoarchaeota archaeon]|nr:hypothetical protein [Nanoarchaeota archaeon]